MHKTLMSVGRFPTRAVGHCNACERDGYSINSVATMVTEISLGGQCAITVRVCDVCLRFLVAQLNSIVKNDL